MAWTDARLEERFNGIDRRFDEVDRRFDEAERRVNHQFDEAERRVTHQFGEVNRRLDGVDDQIAELRQGMATLHTSLNRGSVGIIASLVGVIAAILVKGG